MGVQELKKKIIEKRLLKKAVKVIMKTRCDQKSTSVETLIYGFSKVFHSVTGIPVYTWWNDGSPIYPQKDFLTSLPETCTCYSLDYGWKYIKQKKWKFNVEHQYYYQQFLLDGRNVFTYAIDISNFHCRGHREYMMKDITKTFFSMTHPYITVWMGENKMNPLKLPDIHYYYNKLKNYYGAIYLRPRNYRLISPDRLTELYTKWMAYFDNRAAFSLTMDADCLVILLRYTTKEKSNTDYAAFNVGDVFNKIAQETNEGEEPLYDAYSFYNNQKTPFDQHDLQNLRLTISVYELEHNFHYYNILKTNHFFDAVTTYEPPFRWSNYQNKPEPIESSLPPEIIRRYRKRIDTAKKKAKAKELQRTNIQVTFH